MTPLFTLFVVLLILNLAGTIHISYLWVFGVLLLDMVIYAIPIIRAYRKHKQYQRKRQADGGDTSI